MCRKPIYLTLKLVAAVVKEYITILEMKLQFDITNVFQKLITLNWWYKASLKSRFKMTHTDQLILLSVSKYFDESCMRHFNDVMVLAVSLEC